MRGTKISRRTRAMIAAWGLAAGTSAAASLPDMGAEPLTPVGVAEAASAPDALETRLRALHAATVAGKCDEAVRIATPIAEGAELAQLTADGQALVFTDLVSCEYRANPGRAYAHALRATETGIMPDPLWQLRLGAELREQRWEEAVTSIEAMAERAPEALNRLPLHWVGTLSRMLREAKEDGLRLRLLKVLTSDRFIPEDAFGVPPQWYRLSYAEMLHDAGDEAGARAEIARITRSDVLIQASLDRRFRAFFPADPDIRGALEAELAGRMEAIERYPRALRPLLDAAEKLRKLARHEEALALLAPAEERLADPNAFDDQEDLAPWLWDSIGRSHAKLGHYEQAVAAFSKGAAMEEFSSPNVSQMINLAWAQVELGRGEEALKTLAPFGSERRASPYGKMEMRLARVCARAVAGRPGEAAADLAYAVAHEADHKEALADMYLCLGDMDKAAAAFIRRLEDPDRQIDALEQLSDYDPPPAGAPTGPIGAHMPALKARADVQAAIAKAGGIRRFRMQRPEL